MYIIIKHFTPEWSEATLLSTFLPANPTAPHRQVRTDNALAVSHDSRDAHVDFVEAFYITV